MIAAERRQGPTEAERAIAAEGPTGTTQTEKAIAAEGTTKAAEMAGYTGVRVTVEPFLRLAGRQS